MVTQRREPVGASRRQAPAAAHARPVASERRIITMLAFDIVGSMRHIANCDPDDAQSFFDRCFAHMRKAIEGAGGTLVSFEGDGGVAAFGWPQAHEDHAERACTAAWDIQAGQGPGEGPDGRAVQFRVGVHSGLVALRKVRRGGRARLDTVGAAVHIAAKLQQSAAPAGILVSGETVRLCSARLALAPRPVPSVLDGVTAGVFSLEERPAGRRETDLEHRYAMPMIGRHAELTILAKHLPRPRGGSTVVGIAGEPGIGKSRLVAAAVVQAAASDASILVFFGDAQRRSTSFAVARDILEKSFGPAVDAASLDPVALSRAGLEKWEIDALPSALARLYGKGQVKGPPLTERQLARLYAAALVVLSADRPTLLVVEDIQLVDAESREFLRLLVTAAEGRPICVLVTGRPESLEWLRGVAEPVLLLKPLPKGAMKGIGRQLWRSGALSRASLDVLVGRAEGIPLVLEELVKALEESGEARANALPQRIGSIVHVRLQRLTEGARHLAEALSLVGGAAEIEFVSRLLGREAEPMLDELMELERFAFIHPLTGGPARIRHQIIAEACVETLPLGRRRALHEAALRSITERVADPAGQYEQLAFHAEGAGDDVGAIEYLWQAALEARRSSATASLNLIFDRAMRLIASVGSVADERYVDFVLMAFASLVQLGEFDKVNRHLTRVMELARQSGDPARISGTLSQLGMICWFEGRYREGLRATEEGLAIARQCGSPVLIYANLIMQTNILHDMGCVRRAIAEQRELCEMLAGELQFARLGAPSLPSATASSFMSWFLVDVGAYADALVHAQRGLEIARAAKCAYSEVLARHALGRNLLMMHRNQEAVECLQVAREISERNGYDAIRADIDGRIAIALTRCGRPAEAIRIVEACRRRKLHCRTGQLEIYYLHAGHAEALLATGETEQGLVQLEVALEIARRIHNPSLIVDALGLRARMLAKLIPEDGRIKADLSERGALCERYGLVPWPEGSSAAVTPLCA